METRYTEHGSIRYSFPLGKQNPSEVLRIFERDNKLSFHQVHKWIDDGGKLKSVNQFVLAVKDNKLYMYLTVGRKEIRGVTLDRVPSVIRGIAHTVFNQSGENKKMGLGSMSSVKKLTYNFLRSHIDWYPRLNSNKVKLTEIIAIASSKITADIYKYEGSISTPPGVVQNILRHSNTLSDMSKKIFGFTSPWANEQSNGILAGKMPFALLFKGILPIDDIKKIYDGIKFKHDNMSSMYWFMEIPKIRRFFRMFHKDTIINWYKPTQGQDDYSNYYNNEAERWLQDAVRMWEMLPEELRTIPRGMTSLKHIHDFLSVTQRKMAQSDFKLKPSKKALEIDGHIVNDMEIVVPKTNYELIEWGTHMSNCIASYAGRNATLFGIKRNGVLQYCIEINQGAIWQFKAKYNKEAPKEDYTVITDYLTNKELVKERDLVPMY